MTQPFYNPTYDAPGTVLNTNTNDVFVFKTNIATADDLNKITLVMSEEYRIKKWSVDMHDIDKVLRIESQQLKLSEILELTRLAGYWCEELPD